MAATCKVSADETPRARPGEPKSPVIFPQGKRHTPAMGRRKGARPGAPLPPRVATPTSNATMPLKTATHRRHDRHVEHLFQSRELFFHPGLEQHGPHYRR